jgi:hypothetical protein
VTQCAHPLADERQARPAGREHDDAAPWPQHPGHARERGPWVLEQVEGTVAADCVEGPGAERQVDRVTPDIGHIRRVIRRGVGHGAAEHGRRGVDADHQAVAGHSLRQGAGHVAGPAGDVQHGRARRLGEAKPVAAHS